MENYQQFLLIWYVTNNPDWPLFLMFSGELERDRWCGMGY